jgi:hypothetical protein
MRVSRGKGKPQLTWFVLGLPVVAHYRPPVPTTGTHFAILFHTSASEEKISFGGEFLSPTEFCRVRGERIFRICPDEFRNIPALICPSQPLCEFGVAESTLRFR